MVMHRAAFIDVLTELDAQPAIEIAEQFHSLLSIQDWRRLALLNITKIRAMFMESITREYIEIVGAIHPPPMYTLDCMMQMDSSYICPEIFRAFAEKIRLSRLQVHCFNLDRGDVREYVQILEETHQAPLLAFSRRYIHPAMTLDLVTTPFTQHPSTAHPPFQRCWPQDGS